MKDYFSSNAEKYARYRPTYPLELFSYLASLVENKINAWDCGTGNGQVANHLSKFFKTVYATDISHQQLENALQAPNIIYKVEPAEQSSFPGKFFDLITVAQAIHWFDFSAFYTEVNRVLKPGGILAVIGYGLIRTQDETNALIQHLYKDLTFPYWDEARRFVDEHYQTIPFPFKEIDPPIFTMKFEWTLEHLLGYLNTWSGVNAYIKEKNEDPVDMVFKNLKPRWTKGKKVTVEFPLLLRIGSI